jgi:hypothetical protein
MASLRERLKAKGWHEDEIEKTVAIVEEAKKKKTSFVRASEGVVYWIALFLMIIGNFFMSVLLIPFQLVFSSGFVYVAVAILGLSFGIIFTAILWEIENLETKRYIIEWIFIPAIALINVYIMVALSNNIAALIKDRQAVHSAPVMAASYVVAFVLPYAAFKTYQYIKNR